MRLLFFGLFLLSVTSARKGFGPTDQEWGYVDVREGAHMFWWLHKTSAQIDNYTDKPLVIWLQGGPGASSTGYGNFAELGPLDADLNPRDTTWIKDYNVLFVDNPVGTGYSYVDDSQSYATNNSQIAKDFVELLKGFYKTLPELKNTPLHIFSESYGGKMTAEIGLQVYLATKSGDLDAKLVSVGLGDSWISPIDSVLTWGPYLFAVGAVDQNGYEEIQKKAEETKKAIENGKYIEATNLWSTAEAIVELQTANIDFYNILKKIPASWMKKERVMPGVKDDVDEKIEILMNTDVKQALGIDVQWGAQSGGVFDALYEDFMKPVTSIVERLLNETDIHVAVYNGQLDLIVDTPGTMNWVDVLNFPSSEDWKTASRKAIKVEEIVEGYYKKLGNLAVYWVDRAGHMVPADNPAAMSYILVDMTQNV